MKIAIIGSTEYRGIMLILQREAEEMGHIAQIPCFDNDGFEEKEIIRKNRELIEWADEVWVLWNGQSLGTMFDLGMAYMARKKVVIKYRNPCSFWKVIESLRENDKDSEGSGFSNRLAQGETPPQYITIHKARKIDGNKK